jgi:ribosomal protein S18 acetylase RimI-like enzyme
MSALLSLFGRRRAVDPDARAARVARAYAREVLAAAQDRRPEVAHLTAVARRVARTI